MKKIFTRIKFREFWSIFREFKETFNSFYWPTDLRTGLAYKNPWFSYFYASFSKK